MNYSPCPRCGNETEKIPGSKPCYQGWQCTNCGAAHDLTELGPILQPATFENGSLYGGAYWIAGRYIPVVFLVNKRGINGQTMEVTGGWGAVEKEVVDIQKSEEAEFVVLRIVEKTIVIFAHSVVQSTP